MLGQLAAGNHTLFATGQTSRSVLSLRLAIGLAATGNEFPIVPIGVAGLLVLVGGAVLITRRRVTQ